MALMVQKCEECGRTFMNQMGTKKCRECREKKDAKNTGRL